jgi:lysophospholipase L1-like esterase
LGKWFKDKFNPQTIKNYAWSGATWTNTINTVATDTEISSLDDNNTIWQQIRRLIADVNNNLQVTPDVVIIAAGVNDVIGNEAGERPEVFSKTAEQAFSNRDSYITGASVQTITTLADSVRYGCEMLIQAFPNVQIILTTPLQATKGDTPLDKMATARQIIKDCAAFLSANVIEQDKVCCVYYTQEKVGHHNLYDGLHTNATGAKKIGRIIASIVKSMID